jgi:hypothetical protein
MKSKIKVNVEDLIQQIISKKNEEVKNHKEKLAKYEKELPVARKKLAKELQDLAKVLLEEKDIKTSESYRSNDVEVKTSIPDKVRKQLDTSNIDRDISILKISSDKTIYISDGEYREYF